jgi:hypothetical protein
VVITTTQNRNVTNALPKNTSPDKHGRIKTTVAKEEEEDIEAVEVTAAAMQITAAAMQIWPTQTSTPTMAQLPHTTRFSAVSRSVSKQQQMHAFDE